MRSEDKRNFADSILAIYKFIDSNLKSDGKRLEVRYRNRNYVFSHPATLEEKKLMDKQRNRLAKFFIRDAFNQILKRIPHPYEMWSNEVLFHAFDRISYFESSKHKDNHE